MKESIYKDYGELLLFLNAATVAKVLGASPSSGYELMHVVVTNSVSLAPPQSAGLAHFGAPPLPRKRCAFVRGPLSSLFSSAYITHLPDNTLWRRVKKS